jgi:hypothetical protein
MTFYLGRTVTLVNYWDEFTFGLQQQPELSIPTVDAWIAIWQKDAAAGVKDIAIIDVEDYPKLQARGIPMRVVAEDTRRLAVANL